MVWPSDFGKKVLEKLQQKGMRTECEMCGKNDWSVVEQPVSVYVSGAFISSHPQIPSASLICNNCGNMRLFALGALGLLGEAEGTIEKEKGECVVVKAEPINPLLDALRHGPAS